MSQIGSVGNSLIQSQLNATQLRENIAYAVAAKSLNVVRDQGAAVLSLLDQVVEMAENAAPEPTASPLGRNINVRA